MSEPFDIEKEFDGYCKKVFGKARLPEDQFVELRRVFYAGIHLAACRCHTKEHRDRIIEKTMEFSKRVEQNLDRRRN